MSMTDIPSGWVSEQALAGRWDLQPSKLTHYRQAYLRDGIHFGRPNGLQIYYTPEGIRALAEHFRPPSLEEVEAARLAEKQLQRTGYALPPTPGTPLSEHICRVIRLCNNPRMLTLENAHGRRFYLYVTNNSKFRKGMLVDLHSCKFHEPPLGSLPTLELRIPLPRFPGRWGYSALTDSWLGRSGEYIRRRLVEHAGNAADPT